MNKKEPMSSYVKSNSSRRPLRKMQPRKKKSKEPELNSLRREEISPNGTNYSMKLKITPSVKYY
jgi:hypothetical protein